MKKIIKTILPNQLYEWYCHKLTDIYIISFPKAGRTWIRMLIGTYINELFNLKISLSEISITQRLHNYSKDIPRIAVSHYGDPQSIHLDDIKLDAKKFINKNVVLLFRDPRPMSVSNYYQFMFRGDKEKSRIPNFKGNLDEFVLGDFGGVKSIIKYYNQWIDLYYHNTEHFRILRYEDFLAEPELNLEKIIKLLGLPVNQDFIQKSLEFCTVDNLKKLESNGQLNRYHFGGNNDDNFKVRSAGKKKWHEEVSSETKKILDDLVLNRLDKRYSQKLL